MLILAFQIVCSVFVLEVLFRCLAEHLRLQKKKEDCPLPVGRPDHGARRRDDLGLWQLQPDVALRDSLRGLRCRDLSGRIIAWRVSSPHVAFLVNLNRLQNSLSRSFLAFIQPKVSK